MTKVSTRNSLKKTPTLVAGLDIGSSKVALVIGTVGADGISVVGVGRAPCAGVRQGVVVNIDQVIEAIQKAREEAELMAGYKIDDVWVSVAGSHIKSFDSKGMVAIKGREVNSSDVERVIEAAKAVAVPGDREVLHVLPREYKLDEQEGIADPVGMSGVRLEASVHIVTAGHTALQNLMKCIARSNLRVAGLVLQPLASSLAVLSEDERNLGVALVDMGGGTSDLVIYLQGSVAFTAMVPVGGNHFTHDVSMGLRTPQNSAEELKKKYGCALIDLVNESETVDVPGVGGRNARTVARRHLCEIIEPRAEETLNLIHAELMRSGFMHRLGSGVVFTGGASLLDGLVEMGEFVCDVPVRRGVPTQLQGLTDVIKSPVFATCVGLLIYAQKSGKYSSTFEFTRFEENVGQTVAGLIHKVKEMFNG